ncbi:MAG: glutamate 5-kinase [Cyclobacteriaceae bacterium]|nr:glutamate 5-kinase [Cyclobacteriaceae bacterium]
MKPILILKIGTASITKESGDLDQVAMVDITRQIASIHDKYNVIIVSSGAVGNGRNFLSNYQGNIIERKAAAAIGNPLLINKYTQFFAPYEICIAQSLCERQHFTHPSQFQQLKATFEELWKNGIIPIANENDVVSNLELKFSDNDELATLLAVGFGADVMLLGTSVDGVYDQQDRVISFIEQIDESILGLARAEKTELGLGGMSTKLTFARLATKMGIKTVIFNSRKPEAILKAINGETGTVCKPQQSSSEERMKWLLSGNLVRGKLQVDHVTCQALRENQGLKLEGVKKIIENFERGEVFEILNGDQASFAVARAMISSKEILENLDNKSFEIAPRTEIILL